ncbi:hypothetical protein I307_05303 [Cryptococcus deuterogattii 99/473]|uniref:Unplaced genomic scaffold supercont1.19, whole genome shotgun sequence n=1 Tax=Cryptococcus deuterogattii Ram5 TaxID=1296110 RepID=A0A0D0UYI2_9TREE|nr:hypothetical protein I313_06510 [Cryptococcus deuterogattii Ram5]KIY55411.1 hypothetical protein I307_05303 [Cryptococcus deuterogattii 99/473]
MVVLDCVKARGTYDSPIEKPACLEVEELDELIKIAKETSHFFMEVFYADFFMDENFDALPDFNRMINPSLGGGSLLDMSADPSVWAMLRVHRHSLNADKDSKCDEGDLVIAYGPSRPHTFYIHPRPSHFPGPKGTITSSTTHYHPFHDETMGCHTKQTRLRGVLGMERLRVRGCHGRRAGSCRVGLIS